MKKILMFLSVSVAAVFVLIFLLYNNLFDIRDWIAEEVGWNLNGKTTDKHLDSASETELKMAGGKPIIEMLNSDQLSETKFCDPLKEGLEKLIFPEGSYLDGYHVEKNEDAAGEVYEEYHPYIYTFRVVLPKSTLVDFRSVLQGNGFNQISLDSKMDGTWYVSDLFGNYPKDQYTFAASYMYYIDEESFRSVGGIFIDIIEPDGDAVIIITAY